MLAIIADPANHYHSLAPPTSNGILFDPQSLSLDQQATPCNFSSYWASPESRALLYIYMSAMIFSAVIEPLLLFVARFRLRDPYGTQVVMQAVLASYFLFDCLHAGSTLAVVGWDKAWGPQVDFYAAINVWAPVGWMAVRSLWFLGFGREVVPGDDGGSRRLASVPQTDAEKRKRLD